MVCDACHTYKVVEGTTKCKSCTGILKHIMEQNKKHKLK